MILTEVSTKGIIDWDSVIKQISNVTGSVRSPNDTIDSNKTDFKTYNEIIAAGRNPHDYVRPAFVEMIRNLIESGYDLDTVVFENYYPDLKQYSPNTHFSKEAVEDFQNLVGYEIRDCWISKVYPYSIVPFHKDEYDQEYNEIDSKKDLVRFMVYIDKPIKNQIFIIDDCFLEDIDQHTVIKWNSDKSTHAFINCSPYDNFLFHFLGYKR